MNLHIFVYSTTIRLLRFITFTGNPRWAEITRNLLPDGQQAHHRADVVCRIFMAKANELIKDLTVRQVMGPVAGWCYSMEHQKRGIKNLYGITNLAFQGCPTFTFCSF
jgi:hypothetical protein